MGIISSIRRILIQEDVGKFKTNYVGGYVLVGVENTTPLIYL